MSDYSQIISVNQLREEIGDPTTNTQFAGYVSDDMLRGIIDRHVDWMESQALQRLEEGTRKPVKQTDPVEVSLENRTELPGIAVGNLGENYFPYATEGVVQSPSDHQGKSLDWQPNLIREAQKIFHNGAYLFDIEDDDVLVYPETIERVTVFAPSRTKAVEEIMADMVSEINNNIINKARTMMEAREAEFAEPAFAGGSGAADLIQEE